eukprot:9583825-Lingulodinium_polyedra.AAC.1
MAKSHDVPPVVELVSNTEGANNFDAIRIVGADIRVALPETVQVNDRWRFLQDHVMKNAKLCSHFDMKPKVEFYVHSLFEQGDIEELFPPVDDCRYSSGASSTNPSGEPSSEPRPLVTPRKGQDMEKLKRMVQKLKAPPAA